MNELFWLGMATIIGTWLGVLLFNSDVLFSVGWTVGVLELIVLYYFFGDHG